MKISKLMLTGILISFSFAVSAQVENTQKGLYLTENDFVNHRIQSPPGQKGRMRTNEFLGSNYVTLSRQGGYRKTFFKDDIFGYHKDGKDYRFFKSKTYRVLDTAGFVIYSSETLIPQGKGYFRGNAYFFSLNTKTDLYPLTISNLSRSFSKIPEFYYAVQSFFKSDQELIAYDNAIKQYKLKYLYIKNIQPKALPLQAAK